MSKKSDKLDSASRRLARIERSRRRAATKRAKRKGDKSR
jgi:hypothetical protein